MTTLLAIIVTCGVTKIRTSNGGCQLSVELPLLCQANPFSHASFLQVTGENLVPMTLQKQNVVTAVIADVLTPSAVFYINCTAVEQSSAAPGSNTSTAVVSLILQQDADAVYIGHVTFLMLHCDFPLTQKASLLSVCS